MKKKDQAPGCPSADGNCEGLEYDGSALAITKGKLSFQQPNAKNDPKSITSVDNTEGQTATVTTPKGSRKHSKENPDKTKKAHARIEDRVKQAKKQPGKSPGLSKGKKVGIGIGASVLTILLGVGIFLLASVLHWNSNLQSSFQPNELMALNSSLTQPSTETDPYYVLIVGSDTRVTGEDGRSDTIVLCRVNPVEKQVSILSIPRDTKVQLTGHGTQKINAAMALDGAAGAVQAVSDFVGVPITHYVQIDFSGFKDIVNALGGVTVDVPAYTFYDGIALQPGTQTLNGDQALVFARCRKTYAAGDFQRAANQRQLLKAVADKILTAQPTRIPGLITSLTSCVTTDMNTADIIQTAMSLRGMSTKNDMFTGQVPCTTATIGGVSYALPVPSTWESVRQKFIDGVVPFVSEDEKQPNVIESK